MALEKTHKSPRYGLDQIVLERAVETVEKLLIDTKLLAWQTTLGQDPHFKLSWNDIVCGPVNLPPEERERQA